MFFPFVQKYYYFNFLDAWDSKNSIAIDNLL